MKNAEIVYIRPELKERDFPVKFHRVERKNARTQAIISFIEFQWQNMLTRSADNGTLMFNGKLINMADFRIDPVAGLEIGYDITDYKTYVGTRNSEFLLKFPDEEAITPIAICVAIITGDNRIIIEMRNGVDVDDGKFHVLGGYMDPDKDVTGTGSPDPVITACREVREETGISLEPGKLFFLGVVKDKIIPHYEFQYLTRITAPFSTVIDGMRKAKTDGEVSELEFVDATPESLRNFIQSNQGKISATGESCLLVTGRNLFGIDWYEEMLKTY